jgi:predicted permease
MTGWILDLRGAAGLLWRRPLFTGVAAGTLALAIAANTTLFALLQATVLRPPAYPDPGRLVVVRELGAQGNEMAASWPGFRDWQAADVLSEAGAYSAWVTTVLGGDRPRRAPLAAVSTGFFAAMGVQPAVGRVPRDEEHPATPLAVVSHSLWREGLGGRALAGLSIEVEGHTAPVVGVMPPGFDFPPRTQVWVPLELLELSPHRSAHNHQVIARLAHGVTPERAERELSALTRRMAGTGPDSAETADYLPVGARVRTLQQHAALPVRTALYLLLGAAGFVLLVACANLTSTFLARGMERQRELGVRAALGASRIALLRRLLSEGALLGLLGGAGGVLLAATVGRGVVRAAPPLLAEAGVRLDGGLVVTTVAVAALSALLASLLPALLATGSLAAGVRGGRSEGISPAQRRTWSALVGMQAALALLLLVGAGLLLRSFAALLAVEPGFAAESVATLTVAPPLGRYGSQAELAAFHERLLAAVEATPGVEAAGAVSSLPLGSGPNGRMRAEPDTFGDAEYRVASGGYFPAMGIPLVAGRLFGPGDRHDAPHVAIVDQAAAALFWPEESPLGKRILSAGMDEQGARGEWATVVGVVGDVRQNDLAAVAATPTAYFAISQRPKSEATVVARSRSTAGALLPALRQVLAKVGPDVPGEAGTLGERLVAARAQRRFALLLLAVFAALTLALAAVGVYGVVGYAVARRTRELGLRLALGAAPRQARGLVLRIAMTPVAAGIACGLLAAVPLTRTLVALLYEVRPWDPLSWLGGAALLAGAALLSSWLPSRRVLRLDPMQTLRAE